MHRVPNTPWRCVSATPWLAPLDGPIPGRAADPGAAALARFTRQTWRLPATLPGTIVRHALSPLLPAPPAAVARLVRALHGRLTVVNHAPVAALDRVTRALVAGLVATARDREPLGAWSAAPRGGSAAWPPDSQAAYARVLAADWLARHDAISAWDRGRWVSVRLYEGTIPVHTAEGGALGPEHAADVRARVGARLPARTLQLPRLVATPQYRLAVVTAAPAHAATQAAEAWDRQVAAELDRTALGSHDGRGEVWFSGAVLLPDVTVVEAMDARARQRWAGYTGRAGAKDAYWYPESWERFAEPGRAAGYVSPATVGTPARRAPRAGAGFTAAVERGVAVPPGYGLVDCVGTLAVTAVVL